MNYIWDLVIKAKNGGIQQKDLYFMPAAVYSPYMELSYEDLNTQWVDSTIEINPYYRFHSIFYQLLDVNVSENEELRKTLFDIVVHLLADIDVMHGMSKREYYIRFLIKDIEMGVFGEEVKLHFTYFQQLEKEIVANHVLRIYETGEKIFLLKETISQLFPRSTVYANCNERDEILIYIGQKETEEARAKIELILALFLPVLFHVELYWQYHFGIIEIEETMMIDRIALY